MKICENCGTISEFSNGKCKACCNSKITDLKISTQEWFNLTPTQKETIIKNTLSLSDETYESIQEAWRNNKKMCNLCHDLYKLIFSKILPNVLSANPQISLK